MIAAEGVCYLFEDNFQPAVAPSQPTTVSIPPAISMTIPTNTTSILIADLGTKLKYGLNLICADCDGNNELILGTSDGTVTCYSLSYIKDMDAVPYAASVANYANINGSTRDLSFLRTSGGNFSPSGSFSSGSATASLDSSAVLLGFSFPFSKICALLQQLVDVYKRHYTGNQTGLSNANGEKFLGNIITTVRQVEDDSLLPVIAKSPEFKDFEKSVKELQQVPPLLLKLTCSFQLINFDLRNTFPSLPTSITFLHFTLWSFLDALLSSKEFHSPRKPSTTLEVCSFLIQH